MKKKMRNLEQKDLGQGHQVPVQGHHEVPAPVRHLGPGQGPGQDQRIENGPDTLGLGPGNW